MSTTSGAASDTAASAAPAPGETVVGPMVPRSTGWVLTLGGLIGLIAAGVLSIEKYLLLTNPFFTPSCELGSAVSCQTIMESPQAALFGFPNPYLGLVAFPVVLTLGVLVLTRVRFPRGIWVGLLLGCVAGAALVGWLMWQSLVVIQALCPYCMAVWVVTAVLLVQVARVVLGPRSALARVHLWLTLGLVVLIAGAVTAGILTVA